MHARYVHTNLIAVVAVVEHLVELLARPADRRRLAHLQVNGKEPQPLGCPGLFWCP